MSITLGVTALDCPDPYALAEFYGGILGQEIDSAESDEEWVELTGGEGGRLAFQRAPGHVPPDWPGNERGQQLHLDFDVPRADIEAEERRIVALGARPVPGEDHGSFRVYLDPVGHPFCLCLK